MHKQAAIMFEGMPDEEQDLVLERFRRQEISTIITTDYLTTGLDLPELQLVINADVPKMIDSEEKAQVCGDSFMSRARRIGRFG